MSSGVGKDSRGPGAFYDIGAVLLVAQAPYPDPQSAELWSFPAE
jgi:hypothetical protein